MKSTLKQDDIFLRTNSCDGTIPKQKFDFSDGIKKFYDYVEPVFEGTSELTDELKDAADHCEFLPEKVSTSKGSLKRSTNLTAPSAASVKSSNHDLRRTIQALVDENLHLRQSAKLFSQPILKPLKDLKKDTEDTECKVKLKAIVEENIRLRQILKDVTEVNKRWQKYNQDRQDYVQRLLSTIQDLEQKLQNESQSSHFKSISRPFFLINRHSDSDLLDPSGEFAMLRKSHDECLRENARLLKDNKEIRKNFEELTHQRESSKNQSKELEEMLKLQAKMFKEDFLAEQSEKKSGKAKIEKLYDELNLLRSQLAGVKQKDFCEKATSPPLFSNISAIQSPCTSSSSHIKRIHKTRNSTKNKPNYIQSHFLGKDGVPRSNSANITMRTSADGHLHSSVEQLSSEDNVVTCPRCTMVFISSRHDEFLDHYHQCNARYSC